MRILVNALQQRNKVEPSLNSSSRHGRLRYMNTARWEWRR